MKPYLHIKTCTWMLGKKWKPSRCLSLGEWICQTWHAQWNSNQQQRGTKDSQFCKINLGNTAKGKKPNTRTTKCSIRVQEMARLGRYTVVDKTTAEGWGRGVIQRVTTNRCGFFFFGGVMVAQLCKYIKNHGMAYFKGVNCTSCESSPNITVTGK